MTAAETRLNNEGQTGPQPVEDLALSLSGLSKRFGGTQALDDVSLQVRKGKVHALLGGNGSGKSTTIKILAGVHSADAGTLNVFGETFTLSNYTADTARTANLRFVHQDLGLFHDLTIEENFALGNGFPHKPGGLIDWRSLRKGVVDTLREYGLPLSPITRIADLRPSDRTMVAIARALQNGGTDDTVLLLDEPTASLAQAESERLLAQVRARAEAGQTVVMVSHRMREVLSVAHDFTIFRDGKVAGTLVDASPTEEEIVSIMAGGLVTALRPDHVTSHARDAVAFSAEHLRGGPLKDVNLEVREGEILGIAGLVGSGRTSVLHQIFGVHSADEGIMRLGGDAFAPATVRDAIDAGVALVPEDRGAEAAFPERTVSENLSIVMHHEKKRFAWMSRTAERNVAQSFIHKLGIRTAGPDARLSSMSGGNQQKVILSRWLQRNPRLLLLDEPTQGVDIMSRADLYTIIREATQSGCAVIVASSDMSELIALCDRIQILRDGRTEEIVDAASCDVDELTRIVLIDPKERLHGKH